MNKSEDRSPYAPVHPQPTSGFTPCDRERLVILQALTLVNTGAVMVIVGWHLGKVLYIFLAN